jgi:alcohol dehydrogenase class IV
MLVEGLARFQPIVREHDVPAPTPKSISEVAGAARAADVDTVVAAGGGSVMDAAKAASASLRSTTAPTVVAVPTTPGSGAEVTPFATVWDVEGGRKKSIVGVRPRYAVVDPELTLSIPGPTALAHALDALTQGAEAAWSVRSTAASIAFGTSAVALVADNAVEAVERPGDSGPRLALSLAGLTAGFAIAIAETTSCHAISYPLTLRYGIAHAEAASATVGAMLAYNAEVSARDCVDPRGPDHVRMTVWRIVAALGADSVAEAKAKLNELRELAALAPYSAYGINDPQLAREAMSYTRIRNNPRALDESRLRTVLASLERRSK